MKLEANLPVGIFPIDRGASCLSKGGHRLIVSDSLRIPVKNTKFCIWCHIQDKSLGSLMDVHITKLVILAILTHCSWRTTSKERLTR